MSIVALSVSLLMLGSVLRAETPPSADGDGAVAVLESFGVHADAGESDELAALFTDDADAYLADGQTILRGADLGRLASKEVERTGLQRNLIRVVYLADDVALALQRAVAAEVDQQESFLLVHTEGRWRIRHYQVTQRAPWAAGFVADADSALPGHHAPEILHPKQTRQGLGVMTGETEEMSAKEIEALTRKHERSYNTADPELYTACFAEDAALLPAGGQAILLGKSAILAAITPGMEGGFKGMRTKLTIEELTFLGPRIAVARMGGSIRRADGSESGFPGFEAGLWYRILIREADGSWRYQLQHNTPPAALGER